MTKDVETISDTLNNELQRLLPREKIKKLIGSMIDELGRKVMTEFAALRPKTRLENVTKYREKNKFDEKSLRENCKEFIKNN